MLGNKRSPGSNVLWVRGSRTLASYVSLGCGSKRDVHVHTLGPFSISEAKSSSYRFWLFAFWGI